MFFDVQTILMQKKRKFTDYFLCKMQLNSKYRVYLGPLYSYHGNKIFVGRTKIEKLEAVVTPLSENGH